MPRRHVERVDESKTLSEHVGRRYRVRVLEETRSIIMRLPESPRGSIVKLVREDRDNY